MRVARVPARARGERGKVPRERAAKFGRARAARLHRAGGRDGASSAFFARCQAGEQLDGACPAEQIKLDELHLTFARAAAGVQDEQLRSDEREVNLQRYSARALRQPVPAAE